VKVIAPIAIVTGSTLTSTNVGTALDPAAWSDVTTYALADRCVIGEVVYQSEQAGNLNHTPATPANIPTWWVVVGAINKLAMFDRRVGSQTINANTISVVLTPGEVVDTISLLNLDAFAVTVTQTDPVAGVVCTKVIDLMEPVGDWWEYLYYPIKLATSALITGLLPYRNSTITVLIDNTGGNAACGLLAIGQAIDAGGSRYGATDGIDDYSIVAPDAFGYRDITERDYADDADLTVEVASDLSPSFRRILAARRAQPTIVILADNRPDAQYYGLISFRRTFWFLNFDVYAVTVKGFT
jgi:hypothetical protein